MYHRGGQMSQNSRCACFFVLVFFSSAQLSSAQSPCTPSATVHATASSEPGVGPLVADWYTNADRTIWAMHYDHWRAGVGNKVPWIRPAGVRLLITGRRLDGTAPPLKATVAGVYSSAFQATGMEFPVAGCWEVTGKAGDKELRFVTLVEPNQHVSKAAH